MYRGQAYDRSVNMSGHLRGVAARFNKEEPAVLHVHCLAHSPNLCLQDASLILLVIEITKALYTVQYYNAKLKPLCLTRWTVCYIYIYI